MPRLLLLLSLVFLLASCASDDDPTGPESGSDGLDAAPTSGAPGTVVTLSGPDLDGIDPSALEVRFGPTFPYGFVHPERPATNMRLDDAREARSPPDRSVSAARRGPASA